MVELSEFRHRLFACTDTGHIWMRSANLKTNYCEFDAQHGQAPFQMELCLNAEAQCKTFPSRQIWLWSGRWIEQLSMHLIPEFYCRKLPNMSHIFGFHSEPSMSAGSVAQGTSGVRIWLRDCRDTKGSIRFQIWPCWQLLMDPEWSCCQVEHYKYERLRNYESARRWQDNATFRVTIWCWMPIWCRVQFLLRTWSTHSAGDQKKKKVNKNLEAISCDAVSKNVDLRP